MTTVSAAPAQRHHYDAIVIGAGLGGLLSAATVAKAGGSVLVLERLPYVGGRFTTVQQDGCEITTGALHMVPHGSGGVLAKLLRSLGLPFTPVPRSVYASFFLDGKHFIWKRRVDLFGILGLKASIDLLKILFQMHFIRYLGHHESFLDWLHKQSDEQIVLKLFERFSHFALSIRPDQLSYEEMRAVLRSVFHYGFPEIPVGGCKPIVEGLGAFIASRGGRVLLSTQATGILFDEQLGRVCGVRYRDRHTGEVQTAFTRRIISNAGPKATAALLDGAPAGVASVPAPFTAAAGLKLHIVSEKSLIPHNSIMFCLDTQRISGIVEVSRAVPSLVPPGMHMLDTFQVMMNDDVAMERELALRDLRYVFGSDFDRHCRVVRTSAFRRAWPVNHVIQGEDPDDQEPVPGLVMVGDGYKPTGHIMVEGVAASVQSIAHTLTQP